MNQREKRLMAAVAALLVLWGASRGLTRYRDAVTESEDRQIAAEQSLGEAKTELARSERAISRLRDWLRRSLPTDADVARSLYQDWLQAELSGASVEVDEINDTSSNVAGEHYRQLTFTVSAGGSLKAWTDFFAAFQSAPHLHRVSFASLEPDRDNPSELRGSVTVDALLLNGSRREDRLSEAEVEVDREAVRADAELIVSRDLFAPFRSEAEAANEEEGLAAGEDDPSSKALVTAMTYGRGGWSMTVRREDTGEVLVFREGDRVKIGSVRGRLVEVDGRRATLRSRRGQRVLSLGGRLSEAEYEANSS